MTAPLPPTPGLARRLACMVYEGLLLFGVVMIAGWLYSSLTQQRHALQGTLGLQAFLFVVIGIYFVAFWSRGQTLAMKTWRIQVLQPDGRAPSQARALLRYVASWLWFLPGLAVVGLAGWHSGTAITAAIAINVAVIALFARLHPSRQYPHDLLARTRLVTWTPHRR